jgi:Domain of unknown function (DUF1707)
MDATNGDPASPEPQESTSAGTHSRPEGPGTAAVTPAQTHSRPEGPGTAAVTSAQTHSRPEGPGTAAVTSAQTRSRPEGPGTAAVTSLESGHSPATRASDRERDAVLQRIQQAFAEGRLDDAEFDERMRAALTARTHGDLDALLTDLPAAAAPATAPATSGRGPGRVAIALKSSVRRAGRWRVPERYTTVVYKGGGWLDLRAAELSGPVTTFLAVAYKSTVTILVPPSARVEMTGFGVTQGAADEEDPGYRLPADAPVIHVRGIAYKGAVEITTRPPEHSPLS